jgi:hypothetical protein
MSTGLPRRRASSQARQIAAVHDGQHAQGNRQVEARAFFFDIGRSEIDRRASARPTVTAVGHGGGHAVFAFFDRSVRQTNYNNLRVTAPLVDFDFHLERLGTVEGGGIDLGQHDALFVGRVRMRDQILFAVASEALAHLRLEMWADLCFVQERPTA